MIDPAPVRSAARRRWRLAASVAAAIVVLAGVAALPRPPGWAPGPSPGGIAAPIAAAAPASVPAGSAGPPSAGMSGADLLMGPTAAPSVTSAASTTTGRPVPPPADRLLRLPGAVPATGTGTFRYAGGTGPVLGHAGLLRRFRVAVEIGSGEDVAAFDAQVQVALGDRRSWAGDGRVRLQRVPDGAPHDFTVYLATRDTAGRMCREGGIDITVGGRPYTSCRTTGRAIINLDRWRLSAPPYHAQRVPLSVYRTYVVNHETGHELGWSHEGCPRRGGPAPVMVQQTLTLRGCVPYPWPRLNGRRLAGPPLR